MPYKKILWPLLACSIVACATVYVFNYMALQPGTAMMALGGDATKNYYTYIYHIFNGDGIWFKGINYPYGDHIVYADALPLLSVPLSYLHKAVNFDLPQALAVMHISIMLSFVLGILFTYFTLTKAGVARHFALAFAILIISLSPQVLRMNGHYGLIYFCIIPMHFYWLFCYYRSPRLRYACYVFILTITAAFLHPYFLALGFVFALFYSLAYLVVSRQPFGLRFRHIAPLLISVVVALVAFKVFMSLTDPLKDRPSYPYGLTEYTTSFKQVFTSEYSPLWRAIKDDGLYTDISGGGEGFNYIGLVATAVMLLLMLQIVVQSVKSRKLQMPHLQDGFPRVFVIVAFGALLLGMGVPFIWNMEWLVDYVSLFRQFRSLGRFSWIFYYIITVYSVVKVYAWYKRTSFRSALAANAVMVVVLALWSWESLGYVKYVREVPCAGPFAYHFLTGLYEKKWPSVLAAHHFKRTDFQGIISLPFYHLGSDKLWISSNSGWLFALGARASWQTQLDMVNMYGARASWRQAFDKVKLAAGPIAIPKFLDDLPNDKPFLLMRADYDSISYDEKYLLQAADYITNHSQCHVYAFYPDRYKKITAHYRDSLAAIAKKLERKDTCLEYKGPWIAEHYDNGEAKYALFGRGGKPPYTDNNTVVFQHQLRPAVDSQLYEFSLWALVNNTDYKTPSFTIQLLDSAANVLSELPVAGAWSVDNADMWLRVSGFFYVPATCSAIKCLTLNKLEGDCLALDELMIRPADATILCGDGKGNVMANNHFLIKN